MAAGAAPAARRAQQMRDAWSVVVATAALLVYGVLQERVMTRAYGTGAQAEFFQHSAFLVLCNRLLTVGVLAAHSALAGHTMLPAAPLRSYCAVSASNMLSTLCQYEALKYVSFVTQTLAKTSKALPVVLWGTLVGGKRYRAEQYVHATLITAGCSVFVLGGDISSAVASSSAVARHGTWATYSAGMGLLLVYLAADGWTSTQQEHLFRAYGTSIREQLLYTTAFSSAYSLIAALAGGQLGPAVAFLRRHPPAAGAVLGLSAMSTVIQVCISHVLQQHGALVFALMMTTRQCASVLLSSLLFGHALTVSQWLGVLLVFTALYSQKAAGKAAGGGGGGAGAAGRRSTAGRLPQSRESGGGSTPLLAKAGAPGALGAAHHRSPSSAGHLPALAAAGHHKQAAGGGGAAAGGAAALANGNGGCGTVLQMPALQPLAVVGGGAAAVAAAGMGGQLTPRLHTGTRTGGSAYSSSGAGPLLPPSMPPPPHVAVAPQPAQLPPQLSLPSALAAPGGFRRLWSHGGGHQPVADAETPPHTE